MLQILTISLTCVPGLHVPGSILGTTMIELDVSTSSVPQFVDTGSCGLGFGLVCSQLISHKRDAVCMKH